MSHITLNEETGELRSSLACHVCRRRKIKCGRELPVCKLCDQSPQQCSYPNRASRPGPKIGSTRRNRKAPFETHHKERRRVSRDVTSQHASSEDEDAAQRSNPVATSPNQSVVSINSDKNSQDIQSLSFIIHPSHECCSPEEDYGKSVDRLNESLGNEEAIVTLTCYALGLSPDTLDSLVDTFFQTFTAYRLFREPHFRASLRRIESGAQINALLAAMFAFSSKEHPTINEAGNDAPGNRITTGKKCSSTHFIDLAMEYIDKVLRDCGDEAPPLCLLQALILTAHWHLIQGVRGRAWRYLGTCVRIAYELNLHLVDAGNPSGTMNFDPNRWCENEERRRAWWAIWEMDVFASVIRRCPTAIDWSQNETFLPSEDESWFRNEPQKSCILASGLMDRFKYLQASGNQSPKAWFIVLNSLMKEAQTISSPVGINRPNNDWKFNNFQHVHDHHLESPHSHQGGEASNRLSILYNTLRCVCMALPSSLRYREQYLSFEAGDPRQPGSSSPRHLHNSIYSIHMMTQLTKIMIYKYRVFQTSAATMSSNRLDKECDTSQKRLDSLLSVHSENYALDQYLKAADDVLTIVHTSSENHFRYINPFLANTIWLAAAVQLLHKNFLSETSERELVNSKFEVLYMTYNLFVEYWEMSLTPRQNLEILQSHLKRFGTNLHDDEDHIAPPTARTKASNASNCNLPNGKDDQVNMSFEKETGKQGSTISNYPSQLSSKETAIPQDPFSSNQNMQHHSNSISAFSMVTATTPSDCHAAPRQRPATIPEQPHEYPSPPISYAQLPSNNNMALGIQPGLLEHSTDHSDIFRPPDRRTPLCPTISRMQYLDPGLLDSFNFMHNMGAAASMEFTNYLDEISPLADTC